MTPLHKKGDLNLPGNYRGIAVGSCLSKLFLSVLHNRIEAFVAKNKLVPEAQIGFRRGARTSDHVFTLTTIITKYTSAG